MKMIIPILISILAIVGCDNLSEKQTELPLRSFENRVGTVYSSYPENVLSVPTITEIKLNAPENVDAIWGATGRDDQGHIYIGASTHGGQSGSAYLYQYNPDSNTVVKQSDTVSELKRNNIYREGMRQNKLHSKFYQANDGYLYFSSFDEGEEAEGINPAWGGNLWRKLPNDKHWEHILATEEALVGINTNGRYIYALGYWGHVLYQYDTRSQKIKKVVVGSTQKHVSRNFIVDEKGHSYVPQLTVNDFNEIEVSLAEFNADLKKVGDYLLPSYQSDNFKNHHGIVGYTSMKNGDVYFTTADGGLYHVQPFNKPNEKVSYKGMMHPEDKASIASLFSVDGKSILVGVGRSKKKVNNGKYEWITYETSINLSYSKDLPLANIKDPLLYGSVTRDNHGAFYVVGWQKANTAQYSPLLLRIENN